MFLDLNFNKVVLVTLVIIFRDIGIYIVSTLLTLMFAGFGYIDWWMAVIFLIVYAFLVVAAVIIDKKGMFTKEKWIKEAPKADNLQTFSKPLKSNL